MQVVHEPHHFSFRIARALATLNNTSWNVSVTVPNDPKLIGMRAALQMIDMSLNPPFPAGVNMSNGVELLFGN